MEKIILIYRFFLFFILLILSVQIVFAQNIRVPKDAKLIDVVWTRAEYKKNYEYNFQELLDKPYDSLSFKIKLDHITKELFNAGYFNSKVTHSIEVVGEDVKANILIDQQERINFSFQGNTLFSHQELRNKLIEKVRNEFSKFDINSVSDYIRTIYEEAGFYNTSVSHYSSTGLASDKSPVRNFYFKIGEGKKIKVTSINYRGNSILSDKEINELFDEHSSDLASAGFYDKSFFAELTDILKKKYLSRGYVFIDVSAPRVIFNTQENSAQVEYSINERQQVLVRKFTLSNVPEDLVAEAKGKIINKEGEPINIVELESDLRKLVLHFQGLGYYFTSIANLNSDILLTYDKTYENVDISPYFNLDKKICFNEAVINGNVKTKSIVIQREIDMKAGDIITPDKLEHLRQKLSGLNLFSSLRITPYIIYEADLGECPKTNLVIQVKEKDFGLLEVAPGFRTDIGAKLSTSVSYNNLLGMNHSASLKVQGNHRFNLDGFDERRKQEDKDLFEYSVKATYGNPYLLHNFLKSQLEFETSTSFQKVRYYGFDADVFRISPQISKTFTPWFSTSVKYQFERIVQFNATEDKDNDNFSIGGITPSMTFDFRDNAFNPRKGAYFTLSSEWANSNFGSMKQDDLEVNFIKLINRNRFYIPAGDFTLAISVAMGYQKNFAEELLTDASGNPILNANGNPKTRGYIPSIKVFRLEGYDEIRGYDDGEINRLMDGTPIGEVIVQDEAYFAAFKVEPRYDISDTIRVGVFFDAGRVFVDDFQPMKLRSSVGAGLKYITPVGSLDFDYGFKLQKKTHGDSVKDSVGRFHLSIGYF